MINVWSVSEGLVGCYIPDDTAMFTNKKEAMIHAANTARFLRDECYDVRGNRESCYEYKRPDQEWYPYCITIDSIPFNTRKERDQFIKEHDES